MVRGSKKPRKADGARCRRHGRQQVAGVCPSCLRERLARLSASSSLPSVVAAADSPSPSCYYSSTGASSSTDGYSTGASSGSASPGFHKEMRRAARPSLLMRHERVLACDADEVVVGRRRPASRRTSFWAKLLRATTGGGGSSSSGGSKQTVNVNDGCSLQANSKPKTTLEAETSAATKWMLF